VAGALAALLVVVIYSATRPEPNHVTLDDVEESVAELLATAPLPPAVSAIVYQTILPSLVIIRTEGVVGEGEGIDEEPGVGIGSGVIINGEAAILTALHNVEGATEIEAIFADGTRSPAIIATEQPENDIAVLMPEIRPEIFAPATLGGTGRVRIGDEVFAVGNPLGLAGSMSAGVISGLDRSFSPVGGGQRLEGLIQFDAAVNPGNSGGPLMNRSGHVIGIVTGLVNPTKQEVFIGIGFAVPIDVAADAAGGPAR
jgi:S1-C subfamily serine protease